MLELAGRKTRDWLRWAPFDDDNVESKVGVGVRGRDVRAALSASMALNFERFRAQGNENRVRDGSAGRGCYMF